MNINQPGKYVLFEDINGDLNVNANNVYIEGNDHVIYGFFYIKSSNFEAKNLIVSPSLENVKEKQKEKPNEQVYLCDLIGGPAKFEDIKLLSPVELDYFAEVTNSKNITFKDCVCDGEKFNDPPASKYVLRN